MPPDTPLHSAQEVSKIGTLALREYFEDIFGRYEQENGEIIYPDGSSELHPASRRVGGYGVFFGDPKEVAEPIPVDKEQINNRGELHATLAALQGHRPRSQSLMFPDSTYMVDGVIGRAQKWRRHGWQTTPGPVRHVDLWTQVLDILEKIGLEAQWLHIPSHIGIRGNEKADTLAEEGRRRSPLLRGHVSAGLTALEDVEPPPPSGSAVPRTPGNARGPPPPAADTSAHG